MIIDNLWPIISCLKDCIIVSSKNIYEEKEDQLNIIGKIALKFLDFNTEEIFYILSNDVGQLYSFVKYDDVIVIQNGSLYIYDVSLLAFKEVYTYENFLDKSFAKQEFERSIMYTSMLYQKYMNDDILMVHGDTSKFEADESHLKYEIVIL